MSSDLYQTGKANEDKFRRMFPSVIERTRFDPFDFNIADHTLIELKCRNNTIGAFPITIVDLHKIKEAYRAFTRCSGLKYVIFVYQFTGSQDYWYYQVSRGDMQKIITFISRNGIIKQQIQSNAKYMRFVESDCKAINKECLSCDELGFKIISNTLYNSYTKQTEYKVQFGVHIEKLRKLTCFPVSVNDPEYRAVPTINLIDL